MSKKHSLNEFIEKSRLKFGDKFNYDKVDYINCDIKVTITCPTHGTYSQTPYQHLKSVHGCKSCGEEHTASLKWKTLDTFITKANSIHENKYDYSKATYISAKDKILITCPVHGDFEQLVSGHLSGYGCKKCTNYGKGRVNMDKPCTLYYLHIKDINYFKIGITSLSIEHRYRTQFDREQFEVIFTKLYDSGLEAYTEEQRLISNNQKLLHVGDKILKSGNTEIFTQDIFKGDYSEYLSTI